MPIPGLTLPFLFMVPFSQSWVPATPQLRKPGPARRLGRTSLRLHPSLAPCLSRPAPVSAGALLRAPTLRCASRQCSNEAFPSLVESDV